MIAVRKYPEDQSLVEDCRHEMNGWSEFVTG